MLKIIDTRTGKAVTDKTLFVSMFEGNLIIRRATNLGIESVDNSNYTIKGA